MLRERTSQMQLPDIDSTRIRTLLRETEAENAKASKRTTTHLTRSASLFAGMAAVLLFGAVAIELGHISHQSHPTAGKPVVSNLPTREEFHSSTVWPSTTQSFSPGLSTSTSAPVPDAFEAAMFPSAPADPVSLWVGLYAGGGAQSSPNLPAYLRQLSFPRSAINIDGIVYHVPAAVAKNSILLLSLVHGVVWAVDTGTNNMLNSPAAQQGNDVVYYTPYHVGGGSLAVGAVRIAKIPHNWPGAATANLTTAYSGWIPTASLRAAHVTSQTAYQLHFKDVNTSAVQSAAPIQGNPSGWPNLHDKTVSSRKLIDPSAVASVSHLTRTASGFVLSLRVIQTNGANFIIKPTYYWSETTHKWTPLAQLDTVQTLGAYSVAGSRAVYWQQPLTLQQNGFGVAQMHYNPKTNTTISIWLGNWVFGQSYVAGSSWVNVLASDEPANYKDAPKKWTIYTP